jgi:hypothetical protein
MAKAVHQKALARRGGGAAVLFVKKNKKNVQDQISA